MKKLLFMTIMLAMMSLAGFSTDTAAQNRRANRVDRVQKRNIEKSKQARKAQVKSNQNRKAQIRQNRNIQKAQTRNQNIRARQNQIRANQVRRQRADQIRRNRAVQARRNSTAQIRRNNQIRQNRARNNQIRRNNNYRYRVYRNGSYYNTNSRGAELLRSAVRNGYQQGVRAGRADRYNRHGRSYRNESLYRRGNYGYQSYVSSSQYQYYFKQGFRRGYEDGYDRSSRYGRNNNILGTILSSILNIQTY